MCLKKKRNFGAKNSVWKRYLPLKMSTLLLSLSKLGRVRLSINQWWKHRKISFRHGNWDTEAVIVNMVKRKPVSLKRSLPPSISLLMLSSTKLHWVFTKSHLTNIRQCLLFRSFSKYLKRVLQDWQSFTFNIKFGSYFFWDCSRGNLGRKSNKKQFPWSSRSYYGRKWLHYEKLLNLCTITDIVNPF